MSDAREGSRNDRYAGALRRSEQQQEMADKRRQSLAHKRRRAVLQTKIEEYINAYR